MFASLLLFGCATKTVTKSVTAGFSFDEVSVGALPPSWEVAETNGRGTPGKWAVAEAGREGRCVQLAATANSGRTYNLLLAPITYPADARITVAVRADSGREDQGGGLVWRARDSDNYYVTRWNPLEDNLRAYKVVGGRRTQLASAHVKTRADAWHDLVVQAHGSHIVVSFDGKDLLTFDDSTFSGGGRIGLWTKADAASSFDDFEVSYAIE